MPARRAVHHLLVWALDPRRPLRTTAHPRSRAADRPGVEGRLHRDPPESRTQDRSSDATAARRSPRSRSWAHQSRCRLLTTGGRGEPRQTRDARCHPPGRRVGSKHRLTPPRKGRQGLTPRSTPHRTPHRPTQPAAEPQTTRIPPTASAASHPPGRPTPLLNPRRRPIYTSLLGSWCFSAESVRPSSHA